jgi:hypothetical protein
MSVLYELIQTLEPGQRLCLLPIARVLVEEPAWISEAVAIFPPDSISPKDLRVVVWPELDYKKTSDDRDVGGQIALSGDDLHWFKSAATRIDLPEFFGNALLALPVTLDWDAFLSPSSHEAHLEMLSGAMGDAEAILDIIRFEYCNLWTPQKLPGRAGLLQHSTFCSGLFYAPEDHESYIIAGQILTHQVIAGIGLDLSDVMVRPLSNGEVGSIARHALRMYSEALEAGSETSRFVQMMSLLEFLAEPSDYLKMKNAKHQIARQVARDRADYDEILEDFRYLSCDTRTTPKHGLRHDIVHCGRRFEDLADRSKRVAIFKRLARYACVSIQVMRDRSEQSWESIKELRASAVTRLGLPGKEAT